MNISDRVLDESERSVLSYGMKHSIAPKNVPTASILASIETAIGQRTDIPLAERETIRARVASTLQSSKKTTSNLSKCELLALSKLKNDDSIVITPADKGRVTVVMNRSEYHQKMSSLVNDEQTYKKLDRDPSQKLQRKLNNKLFTLHKANIFKRPLYSKLRCSVAQAPKLYGLPKIHKENIPMRPIVSFCSSPTYELSKYLANILKPLTDHSRHRVINTEEFVNRIKNETMEENHELVSFDVKSLFTSIPLQLAIDYTNDALTNYGGVLPIPNEEIIDLLTLCLKSTYFQYNGHFYQQLHGTAMGSPVSVVVSEIVMQRIEEQALSTYPNPPPFWFRYVDDTLTSVEKGQKKDFLDHLNKQNPSIQFTIEAEKDGKLPFLDCVVIRNGNKLQTDVYRKPTNTDRLLDDSSYHPTSHKATTVTTLMKRARVVCSSEDALQKELRHLKEVFKTNNYKETFVQCLLDRPPKVATSTEEEDQATIAAIPYIKGTSETLARILQPYNIKVAHKPMCTLRTVLTKVKDPTPPERRKGAIYKVKCAECPATYIGETGRNLTTRIKEHKRSTEVGDKTNNIAVHHMETKHRIDWESATCLDFTTNYFDRTFLESWYTNLDSNAINVCREFPRTYSRLLKNQKRTRHETTREQARQHDAT